MEFKIEVDCSNEELEKIYPVGKILTYTDNVKYKVLETEINEKPGFNRVILESIEDSKTVKQEDIDSIIEKSEKKVFHRVFGKQCVVVILLENGFTIVGESACVDPDNYIEEIGEEIAMKAIEKKLWELEGYKLQNELL